MQFYGDACLKVFLRFHVLLACRSTSPNQLHYSREWTLFGGIVVRLESQRRCSRCLLLFTPTTVKVSYVFSILMLSEQLMRCHGAKMRCRWLPQLHAIGVCLLACVLLFYRLRHIVDTDCVKIISSA
jgi:hypothetical protein